MAVRDATPVEVPVVVTRRGAGRHRARVGVGAALAPDGGRPDCFSLRTPSQVTTDLGFGAFLPLLRSRTVDDVAAALARWVEPVNSALVADTSGQVRHLVVGRVPERADVNWHRPVDAWDPAHAWTGWRAGPATMVDDLMVSANDRASGGGLGLEYASPYRAARIRELLGARAGLAVDDFAEIHVDTLNGQSVLMRELVSAAEVSGDAATVRDELLRWDGHSRADSRGAFVFAAWRHALVQWIGELPASRRFTNRPGTRRSSRSGWRSRGRSGPAGPPSWGGFRAWHRHRRGRRGCARTRCAGGGPGDHLGDRHWFDPIHALDGVGGAPRPRTSRRPATRAASFPQGVLPG